MCNEWKFAGFEIQTSERLMFAATRFDPAIPYVLEPRAAEVDEPPARKCMLTVRGDLPT